MSFGPSGQRTIRFDEFALDSESGELRRRGRSIKLQAQPSKVLALLTSRSGEVVTREEIQKELWRGETFVDFDKGIYYCIKEIRHALRDDPEKPRYIKTLTGKGYRFLTPVEIVEPSQA